MKKLISILLAVIMINSIEAKANDTYHQSGIIIYANGHKFTQDNIVIRNSRTLVKYDSGIFEALGYSTNYDIVNREAVIRDGKDIATIFLNEYVIYRNGMASYTADVRSDVINKQIYIPLRGFAESLGGNVQWNSNTREITVIVDKSN